MVVYTRLNVRNSSSIDALEEAYMGTNSQAPNNSNMFFLHSGLNSIVFRCTQLVYCYCKLNVIGTLLRYTLIIVVGAFVKVAFLCASGSGMQ